MRAKNRKYITWVIVGAVVVLLVVAGVDALRSPDTETATPPTTETRAATTVVEAPDTDVSSVEDASTTPDQGAPAKVATSSRLFFLDIRTGEKTPLAKKLVVDGVNFAASRNGRMLAYAGIDDEGESQIFIARIDGTRIRQVTHDPKGATWPAWSPDGTMIAYQHHTSPNTAEIAVLDLATGESTQVAERAWGVGLQFTPDGSSLVYTAGGRYPELRTVPIAGGKSRLLIALDEGLNDSGDGSLSPDGSLVTFLGGGFPTSEGHCGPCRLMANADGSERRVVHGGCWRSNPAGTWSPDGGRIVCSGNRGHVVVVDIATGHSSRVANGNGAIWINDHTLLVEA